MNFVDPWGLFEDSYDYYDFVWDGLVTGYDSRDYQEYEEQLKKSINDAINQNPVVEMCGNVPVDELLWFGMRRYWDFMTPLGTPYPPGFGDKGLGSNNWPYNTPDYYNL